MLLLVLGRPPTPTPRDALGKLREQGARLGGSGRAEAVWRAKLGVGVAKGSERRPHGLCHIPNPQLATPALCPANPTRPRRLRSVCFLGQTRLEV